jgi:hypothetical protein
VSAFNWVNTPSSKVSSNIIAIFDPLSVALLSDTTKYRSEVVGSIPSVPATGPTNSTNPGYRIKTGTTAGSYVNALPTPSGSPSFEKYNHTENISITGNEELQIANGLYVTKAYSGGGGSCYLDYRTYLYNNASLNTFNYSGIPGTASDFRYASFAWKFEPSTSAYAHVLFKIHGLTKNLSKYYMFYRIEDIDNPTNVSSNFDQPYLNTTWIDATNVLGQPPLVTLTTFGDNRYTPTRICAGANTAKIKESVYSGNVYSAYALLPETRVYPEKQDKIYLYLRIGLPMNEDVGFSHVTALLSSDEQP